MKQSAYPRIGAILEQINVGVVVLDKDHLVRYWNPFMATHSGLAAEDAVGRPLFEICPEAPADWLKAKLESVAALKNLAFSSWEYRSHLFPFENVRPFSGGPRYMYQNSTLFPILDDAGEVEGLCITVHDATDTAMSHLKLKDAMAALEAKGHEQEELIHRLEQAQNQLLQSEKMAAIGQLAAGVAHEINNPIGFVYSNINTLNDYIHDLLIVISALDQLERSLPEDHPEKVRIRDLKQSLDIEYLREDVVNLIKECQDGIERVKQIVQSLKDFSHVDEMAFSLADLHKGINSTLNVCNNEIKYKATVHKEFGDIPEVECMASQINQVVMNLVVNAAHAISERGVITVRTGQEQDGVFFEVEDNGSGIKEENLKRIFDPFFTTKPVGKGTGLGLSLSYSIVQKHNGRLSVRSQIGVGTCFHVWLPVRQPEESGAQP